MSVRNQLSDYEFNRRILSITARLVSPFSRRQLILRFSRIPFPRSRWFGESLSVLSSRVRVSHPSERQLLSDLDILLHIVSQQRQHCVNLPYFALHEEEEQQSTTRVGVRIVRSGVGRPRLDISEGLLKALHVRACLQGGRVTLASGLP